MTKKRETEQKKKKQTISKSNFTARKTNKQTRTHVPLVFHFIFYHTTFHGTEKMTLFLAQQPFLTIPSTSRLSKKTFIHNSMITISEQKQITWPVFFLTWHNLQWGVHILRQSAVCLLFCVLTFFLGTAEEEAGCRIKTSLLSKWAVSILQHALKKGAQEVKENIALTLKCLHVIQTLKS